MDCSLPGFSVHGIFQAKSTGVGLPFPSPGGLPDPGIEPGSPASQADASPSEPPEKPYGVTESDTIERPTQLKWLGDEKSF